MSISLDSISYDLHSIDIVSSAGNGLTIDASGFITANINGTVTVDATNLDIRDLVHTQDSVKIGDGVEFVSINASNEMLVKATDSDALLATIDADTSALAGTVSGSELQVDIVAPLPVGTNSIGDIGTVTTLTGITNDVNIADGGNSITVDASDLDIRDLTHVSDSVKIGDGTDFLAVEADGSINVNGNFTEDSYSSWKSTDQDVTSTASEIASTPLASRKRMIIQNLGAVDAYIGESNAVTALTGTKIPKGASIEMKWDATADVWAITSSGTADLRIAEFAG